MQWNEIYIFNIFRIDLCFSNQTKEARAFHWNVYLFNINNLHLFFFFPSSLLYKNISQRHFTNYNFFEEYPYLVLSTNGTMNPCMIKFFIVNGHKKKNHRSDILSKMESTSRVITTCLLSSPTLQQTCRYLYPLQN